MNINVTIVFNKLNLYDNLFGLFLFYRKKSKKFYLLEIFILYFFKYSAIIICSFNYLYTD